METTSDRKQSHNNSLIPRLPLRPEKILILAVLGSLTFCIYLAYTHHMGLLRMDNISSFAGGPIVKKSDLRGNSKVASKVDFGQGTQIPIPMITSIEIPDVATIDIRHGDGKNEIVPIPTVMSTIQIDLEEPNSKSESVFAGYLHNRYSKGISSLGKNDPLIESVDSSTSVASVLELRKNEAYVGANDPKYDSLIRETARLMVGDNAAEGISHSSSSSSDSSVMKSVVDLHYLLQFGSRCGQKDTDADIVASKLDYRSELVLETIQRLVFAQNYKSIIEISAIPPTRTVSQYLAEKHYRGFGSYDPKLKRLYEMESDPTFLLSSYPSNSQQDNPNIYQECLPPVVPNLLVTSTDNSVDLTGNFDCLQYIDDVGLLVKDQMPFEFERSFGLVLCRCNETIIEKQFPDDSFFAYWDSMEALVKASMIAIADESLSCSIEFDRSYRGVTASYVEVSSSTVMPMSGTTTSTIKSPTTAFQPKTFDAILKASKYLLISRSNSSTMSTVLGHLPALQVFTMKVDNPSKLLLKNAILDSPSESFYSTNDFSWSSTLVVSLTVIADKDILRSAKRPKKSLSSLLSGGFEANKSAVNLGITSTEGAEMYKRYQTRFGNLLSADSVVKSPSTNFNTNSSVAENTVSHLSNILSKSMEESRPKTNRRRLGTYAASNIKNRLQKNDVLLRELKGFWFVSKSANLSYFENDPFKIIDAENLVRDSSIKSTSKLREKKNSAWLAGAERLQQLSLRERETPFYLRWIALLRSTNSLLSDLAEAKLMYLFGQRISLLSVKLSQLSRKLTSREPNMIVSILTDALSVQAHEQLMEVMSVSNNILCQSELYLPQLSTLTQVSQMADYAIIQVDVILRLITMAISSKSTGSFFDLFEDMLGSLLSLSRTTLVEMPSSAGLSAILKLPGSCETSHSFFNQYQDGFAILKSVSSKIHVPSSLQGPSLQINIEELEPVKDTLKSTIFKISFTSDEKLIMPNQGLLSLNTLLTFNPTLNTRRKLFKLFLDFPLWKYSKSSCEDQEISPENIFIGFREKSYIHDLYYDYSVDRDGLSLWYRSPCDSEGAVTLGATSGWGGIVADRKRASLIWKKLKTALESTPEDLADGKFSFVEHKSGLGHLSALVAMSFPNATILSLEQSSLAVDYHVTMLLGMNISNNAACKIPSDTELSIVLKNLYETPELFRFQVLARDILQSFAQAGDVNLWGLDVGLMLSTAMTTFISMPSDSHISLSKSLFYGSNYIGQALNKIPGDRSGFASTHQTIDFISHPLPEYQNIDRAILLAFAKTKEGGHTEVDCTRVSDTRTIGPPMLRCDILNMTRHVHHHYDYTKDGHTRTYTMHVEVDNTSSDKLVEFSSKGSFDYSLIEKGVLLERKVGDYEMLQLPLGVHPSMQRAVAVHLFRDKDSFPIPYTSIYGITLISAIRLGLDSRLRDRYFGEFLNLSLYEDMAPWNIVLNGGSLAYIDYDTRDITFDLDISKTYRLMSVLMNYKRTVEDFKKCTSKAATVYNIAFISDCIGSEAGRKLTCPDLQRPVPCGDGTCHSDYISCLRSLSSQVNLAISASVDNNEEEKKLFQEQVKYKFDDNGRVVMKNIL